MDRILTGYGESEVDKSGTLLVHHKLPASHGRREIPIDSDGGHELRRAYAVAYHLAQLPAFRWLLPASAAAS